MLAETAVDAFVAMLTAELPSNLAIKAYVTSEQQMQSVPEFPIVFVLCPNYTILEFQVELGLPISIDVAYEMVIGVLCLDQDATTLRAKLNQITEQFIMALLRSQRGAFEYTLTKANIFRVNFSPIFTNVAEQFTADAQVQVTVRKQVAETFD